MRQWHDQSGYLILLSVPDEDQLLELMDVVAAAGAPHAYMTEPDIGNEHTAVAVAPHPINATFGHLPLQGRELAMVT